MTRRFQSFKGRRMACLTSLILIFWFCALAYAEEPALVTGFAVSGDNGYNGHETSPDNLVTFQCNTSGDPSPLVSIWRYSYFDDSYLLKVGETYGSEIIITANCTYNGRYRCSAENTYQGHPYIAFGDWTQLKVTCPLSSCSGTDEPEVCVGTPGQDASCRLCIVVYPWLHGNLYVEKETENGWEIRLNIKVDIYPYTSQLDVTVQFTPLNFGDLGNLRLFEATNENNNNFSYVYFQMIESASTENTISTSSQSTSTQASSTQASSTQASSTQTTDSESNSDTQTHSDSNSDQDSDSDSYISLSTPAIVDIVLAGLLVLTIFTIVCVYLCGRNNPKAKVGPQPA